MVELIGEHAPYEAELVGHAMQVRNRIGELHAARAAAHPLSRRTQQFRRAGGEGELLAGNRLGRAILAVELPCFLRAVAIPLLVVLGLNPWMRVPLLYALAVATVLLNQLRQLADHHFEGDGSRVDVESHILDSCNFTRDDPLTLLLFPFSIRYHALHHLFPSLPYHNLKPAHEHLVATLPADSPYHTLDRPGWWSVARRTLFGAAATGAAG
jgi:fatty acid desaturase